MAFLSYEDFLLHIEDLLVDVAQRVMDGPHAHLVHELNPVCFMNIDTDFFGYYFTKEAKSFPIPIFYSL